MNPNRIKSIGWLHGTNRTIILTPCIDGSMHPTKVRITMKQFEEIRDDKHLMKQTAAALITSPPQS